MKETRHFEFVNIEEIYKKYHKYRCSGTMTDLIPWVVYFFRFPKPILLKESTVIVITGDAEIVMATESELAVMWPHDCIGKKFHIVVDFN